MLTQDELARCIESRRHGLTRMATSMLGDVAQAEDAVQDAAVSALQAAARFRDDADVCTWFQRICLNSCYQALRRRSSASHLEDAARLEARSGEPGYSLDPETVALNREESARVRRSIARLTPEQRTAVVMHDLRAYRVREIAADTGLPLATVKSHLRRGRQALLILLSEGAEGRRLPSP